MVITRSVWGCHREKGDTEETLRVGHRVSWSLDTSPSFLISAELKPGLSPEKGCKHQGSRVKGVGGEMELRGTFFVGKDPACLNAEAKPAFGGTGAEASGGHLWV